jgi:hypothetical protein
MTMTAATATLVPIFTNTTRVLTPGVAAAVALAAGRMLPAADVDQIAAIVRDPRPAIPRTVWVARVLHPTRVRPRDEVMDTARAVIAAVRAHDYRVARGELAA